jgi:hypothetical protein
MDEQVAKALAKWPNVPHCYGWLALDARGNWRMRDEQAQGDGSIGERITSSALIGFINRNYTQDEHGCWYFQNGPQRVYVELEAAPHIAHIAPEMKLVLHTGVVAHQVEAAWLSDRGRLWLQDADRIALLDDRDLAHCLQLLSMNGKAFEDGLDAWLRSTGTEGELRLRWDERMIQVCHLAEGEAPQRFGFDLRPSARPRQ